MEPEEETKLNKSYEGMFLLDNQAVREDWKVAKGLVTETLEKHGARIQTARRWDERRLAYPVERRLRGTYLLTWFEAEPGALTGVRRDLDLSERVLRYLILNSEGIPEGEQELSDAENASDFSVPAPPPDDHDPEAEAAAAEEAAKAAAAEEAAREKAESGTEGEQGSSEASAEGESKPAQSSQQSEGASEAKSEGGESASSGEAGAESGETEEVKS